MKVQIDLCKLFGVKEKQEFSINGSYEQTEIKHKIENNILYYCDKNGYWFESWYEFNDIAKGIEVEILN